MRSRSCRRWPGSASRAPPAGRRRGACWRSSGVGSGRSWAATATRSAPTSRRTARRRRSSCRSRWPARAAARDTSWRAGLAGPARSSGAARATRSATSRARASRWGRCTTWTRARSPGVTRRAACASPVAHASRSRAALIPEPGTLLPGGPADPAALARPGGRGGRRAAGAATRAHASGAGGASPRRGQGAGAPRRRPAGTGRASPAPGVRHRLSPGVDDPPPLEKFLASLAARDTSPHTQRAYRTAVGAYLEWLAAAGAGWRTPSRTVLRAYLAELGGGRARSSVAQRLAAIRSFHRWARRAGLADADPWAALGTPRRPRRLPPVLTVAEVERIVASAGDDEVGAPARVPVRRRRRAVDRPADARRCAGRLPCATSRSWRRPTRPGCGSRSWPA